MSGKRKEQNRKKTNGQKALFFGTIKLSKKIIFGSYPSANYIFKSFRIGPCKKATASYHCFQCASTVQWKVYDTVLYGNTVEGNIQSIQCLN